MLLVINEQHIAERHLCWYTQDNVDSINMFEVVERTYKHPQCPEHATTVVTEVKCVGRFKRSEGKAATLILLEAAQNAVSEIQSLPNMNS